MYQGIGLVSKNQDIIIKKSNKLYKLVQKLECNPTFPFCKRVSHFGSDLQILYLKILFCNENPVFFKQNMI